MRRWQRLKYVHLRLVTFDKQALSNDFQQLAYKRFFLRVWGENFETEAGLCL